MQRRPVTFLSRDICRCRSRRLSLTASKPRPSSSSSPESSSSQAPRWPDLARSRRCQIYRSASDDPFVNLSLEHFLLSVSPPDAIVLFLYANRQCVVIGRNQNPWLEVGSRSHGDDDNSHSANRSLLSPTLVRRRSGGGAVFHDGGNLNYSVISPKHAFDRDRHADMVARALRAAGASGARVNERHDIVLDGYPVLRPTLLLGTSETTNEVEAEAAASTTAAETRASSPAPVTSSATITVKISGSAYKLTRFRALHHGTCLIASPDVARIGSLLRASPVRDYLTAKGVGSVRSPVGNVGVVLSCVGSEGAGAATATLIYRVAAHIVDEFARMYGVPAPALARVQAAVAGGQEEGVEGLAVGNDDDDVHSNAEGPRSEDDTSSGWMAGMLSAAHATEEPSISAGIKELRSSAWRYGQTPPFIFATHPTPEDPRTRPPLPEGVPPATRIFLRIQSGAVITGAQISTSTQPETAAAQAERAGSWLVGRPLYDLGTDVGEGSGWERILREILGEDHLDDGRALAEWLERCFWIKNV